MDPELLDINVHPAKKEVKIRPSERLYSAVYHAVEEALQRGYYGTSAGTAAGTASLLREPSTEAGLMTGLYTQEGEGSYSQHPFTAVEMTEQEGESFDVHVEELQYRGSIFNTFLIFEQGNDVLLMDQHAAHERVYYDQFSKMYENGGTVKSLLVPINFTPPAHAHEDLVDAIETLREAGIEIEPFGDESFNVLTLPAFIPENREEATLSQLLEQLYAGKLDLNAAQIRDEFVKLAACRSAVKEGDSLSPDEALALMRDLQVTRIPHVCPHGRPTMVKYTRDYFYKQFKRR
jgi:DNA mismatch repair protein MutL